MREGRKEREKERAETEAKIREYRVTRANHTEMLAKREAEAVKQSFEEDRRGRRCPVVNPYDRGIRWWESAITFILCYQAVEIPLRLAFASVLYTPESLLVTRWTEVRCSA